jgi:hypothetical protein
VIGSQLLDVNLMFSNQKVPNGESLDLSSIGLINVVPHFCPGVRKVFFGHWQSSNGSIPHSLCDEDAYFDAKVSCFSFVMPNIHHCLIEFDLNIQKLL